MRPQGFTLIELLIVLVLIAVMAGMAMLAIGNDGQDRRQLIEAQRLASLLALAEQEAMLRGEAMAMEVFDSSYRFLILTEAGWHAETSDPIFRPRQLQEGMRLGLLDNEENQLLKQGPDLSAQPEPQILLTPDAMAEVFEIVIEAGQQSVRVGNHDEHGWIVLDAVVAQ